MSFRKRREKRTDSRVLLKEFHRTLDVRGQGTVRLLSNGMTDERRKRKRGTII